MKRGKDFTANISVNLLGTSGATLSIVTSRLPRSTGSLAIFSGLLGKPDRQAAFTNTYQIN